MRARVTVSAKLNSVIILLSLLAAAVVSYHLIEREQQRLRGLLVEESLAAVERVATPLQFAVFYQNRDNLEQILDSFFDMAALRFAVVYDRNRAPMLERHSEPQRTVGVTDLASVMPGAGLERGVQDYTQLETGEHFVDIMVPLYSPTNPFREGADKQQFVLSLAQPALEGSRYLLGHVRLGLSASPMEAVHAQYAKTVIFKALLLVFVCSLVSLMVVRRITLPLAKVAQMAQDIAGGKLDSTIRVKGSGEVKEIASMLNFIVQSLNSHKTKLDVNQQLLAMKVEERTQQLSETNRQLTQAVKETTKAKERLHQMAYFDSLTVLPNRQFFTEQLKLILNMEKREGSQLALLFIDLDNFKRINDSLGHSAGDQLLKEVAGRLHQGIREGDLISRYIDPSLEIGVSRLGGDEFTVVLNRIENRGEVANVANRLLTDLSRPIVIEGHELVITPSIGIAISPADGDDVEGLLKHADTAMYHAKKQGKNNFQFYSQSMNEMGVQRLKLEADLRRALENEELVLHYQPQVDGLTGRVIGAEALVRWQHPELGLVPPFSFITLAEEMGLIIELGNWVLHEACRQTKVWQEQGLGLPQIAVNLSSLQFDDEGFIDSTRKVLAETGLNPRSLKMELTESVIMKNADATIAALHELKSMGVRLAVDDFGTGYSSLNYLSQFPLDELKIDRSFVVDIGKEDHNTGLIEAIIAMAGSLDLNLVAEGVEVEPQFQFLKNRGVRVIQGYLFSGPLPAGKFEELLAGPQYREQVVGTASAAGIFEQKVVNGRY